MAWGTVTSYGGAHNRVYRGRGRAKNQQCSCGERAREWSYVGDCGEEGVDPRGKGTFCPHPEHYEPLCLTCHRQKDRGHTKRSRDAVSGRFV